MPAALDARLPAPSLLPVRRWDEALPGYRGTPEGDLLAHHALRRAHRPHGAIAVGGVADGRLSQSAGEACQ